MDYILGWCIWNRYEMLNFSFLFFFNILFIYDRYREREREAETQAEGEAGSMHREPDVGFDPGSPGSRPGPKAGAKPLRHPGIPIREVYDQCSGTLVLFRDLGWAESCVFFRNLLTDSVHSAPPSSISPAIN